VPRPLKPRCEEIRYIQLDYCILQTGKKKKQVNWRISY